MDVNFKVDKAIQTGEVLCNKDIICSLLLPDSVLLPVYVPPTSDKYCSICKKKFPAVPFMMILDSMHCCTIWFTSNQVVAVV